MHEECFRGAKFLLRLLESIGCEAKLVQVGALRAACGAGGGGGRGGGTRGTTGSVLQPALDPPPLSLPLLGCCRSSSCCRTAEATRLVCPLPRPVCVRVCSQLRRRTLWCWAAW